MKLKLPLLLVPIFFLCLSVNSFADKEKGNVSFRKECKNVCKELKKGNWKVYGNTLPLDKAIRKYYDALEKGEGRLYSLTGESEANNVNIALQKAQHRANAQYAAQKETHISRTVNMQISNEVVDKAKSHSEFDQTILTNVDQEIISLRPELTLIRQNDNGKVQVKMFFLIEQE